MNRIDPNQSFELNRPLVPNEAPGTGKKVRFRTGGGNGRNAVLPIALAAGLGAAGLFYVFTTNARRTEEAAKTPAPVSYKNVVVAVRDIAPRTPLTADMLQTRRLPVTQVPSDAVQVPKSLVGHVTTSPLSANQPIPGHLVVARGVEMGLAYGIPAGFRALTISLDPVSSVAGFLKPGDHVDVLGTFELDDRQAITRTVLQDVTLLATGSQVLATRAPERKDFLNNNKEKEATNPAEGPAAEPKEIPNATVLVTPMDAQKLALAAQRGKLQLVLRAAGDKVRHYVPVLRSTSITGPVKSASASPAPAPAVAPRPAPVTVPQPAVAPQMVAPRPATPEPPSITVIKGTQSNTVRVGQ